MNVPLPLRHAIPETTQPRMAAEIDGSGVVLIRDSVEIEAVDAIKALMLFGLHDASQWWTAHYGNHVAIEHEALIFHKHEGEIQPASLARILLPGIEYFDDIN